jgi:ribonuclease P protein component
VLGRAHRLTASRLFGPTVRRGRRAGSRTLVVHLAVSGPRPSSAPSPPPELSDSSPARPPQVGFVVSRAVGTAVTRNSVKRRLRHLARERVSSLPDSAVLVVRALPAAATASYQELGADLDRCLERVLHREARR